MSAYSAGGYLSGPMPGPKAAVEVHVLGSCTCGRVVYDLGSGPEHIISRAEIRAGDYSGFHTCVRNSRGQQHEESE